MSSQAENNVKIKIAATPLAGHGDLAELELAQAYFLPAFFASQYAFNLADNFALAAGLIVFFFAIAAGLTESAADLARRRFAHLAF